VEANEPQKKNSLMSYSPRSQDGAGATTDARFFFRLTVPTAALAESCDADGPDDD